MNEFLERRKRLLASIENDSMVILTSGGEIFQSEDNNYDYFTNRNFFYVTNINQANSFLVLLKNKTEIKEYLFINKFDIKKEIWTGRRLTILEAQQLSSVNEIKYTEDLEHFLKTIQCDNVYFDDKCLDNHLLKLKNNYPNHKDIYPLFASLRLIKSESEINDIKHAIKITSYGFDRIISLLKNNVRNEYQIYTGFNYEVLSRGARELGFASIIASGENACCMHYPTPYADFTDNDLILCDVGAAYNHYCSDVTRTFPVSGKFNDFQRKIYQIVLNCNKEVIKAIKPGISLQELQKLAKDLLAGGCISEGIISDKKDIDKYYMHCVSHPLGLDCHDVGGREFKLEAGMVITVEPGLYIKEKHIGVRIEDDVLVTKDGYEVLSKDIKKEINEIEELFRR